jgi:hypothetical protein
VWRVINAFNPSQLELFRVILGNTKFPDSCGSNIIKLKPVKEAGHCKQEVIDLINQLGEFNPHIGSKTIVKKREA